MNWIKKSSRIFIGYVPGKAQETEFQCKAVVLIALIAAPTAAIFSIINYLSDHTWLALVEFITVCLMLPCFKLMHQQHRLSWYRNLLMISALMVFTCVFIDGGVANYGIIWSLVVPFLAFLLMGLPTAWYWVASYALVNALLIILHFADYYKLPYSDVSLIYFPAVFIFFSLIAAIFEMQLERLHRSHEDTIHELKKLRHNLESHAENKTRALIQANKKLQLEIKKHENTSQALQLSEELLLHAQKMEAIGTLVGGIAHDFNNLLAGMTGNLYLLSKNLKEQPDLNKRVSTINQLCLKASDMISQLLAFARKDKVDLQHLPLNISIKEAVKLAMVSTPENIKIRHHFCSDDLVVLGDITQLQQVVLNLMNNARDALEGSASPEIIIELNMFTANSAFKNKYQNRSDSDHFAHLSIQDNGKGIPDAVLQNIFDPFFTTKEQGKGTGLGLAMVYGSIQTHHGMIEVESKTGCGSTFHIYLPLIQATESFNFERSTAVKTIKGQGETILLVDDETQIRKTIGEVLEDMGYKVLLASNGVEAISLYNKHQQQIALTILDLVMPIMGGREAADKIRQLNHSAPILFATAYDEKNSAEEHDDISSQIVLKKPFSFELLSSTIYKLLHP